MRFATRGTGRLCVLLLCLAPLPGCTKLGGLARIEPTNLARYDQDRCKSDGTAVTDGARQATKTDKKHDTIAIDLDCFRFPEDRPPAKPSGQSEAATAYQRAAEDEIARNRLAAILMTQSDAQCTRESAKIVANEAAVNGSLSILATGLASAGSLVTGQIASNALAGAAAFVNGSRDHINATVYRNQITQGITAAIAAERQRLRDEIVGHFTDKKDVYTVDQMIRDVAAYHQTCSFYKGIELLLTSAQQYPKLAAYAEKQQLRSDVQGISAQIDAIGHDSASSDTIDALKKIRAGKLAQLYSSTVTTTDTEDPQKKP